MSPWKKKYSYGQDADKLNFNSQKRKRYTWLIHLEARCVGLSETAID